jgi:hypothetical protein
VEELGIGISFVASSGLLGSFFSLGAAVVVAVILATILCILNGGMLLSLPEKLWM